jgi:hypothetical protein
MITVIRKIAMKVVYRMSSPLLMLALLMSWVDAWGI